MKIYDTHSDVFSNLYERKIKGENNVFEKYHLNNLTKGEVVGGIWVIYSECDFDLKQAYDTAIKEFAPYKNNYDVIYGLEGLRNVHSMEEFEHFYNIGVRHAMLTWNEENMWATGVGGNPERGLTNEGEILIKYMEAHQMIVDVSHLNVKSFYDVLKVVTKPVIASHSSCYAISDHRRNLNDEQLLALKNNHGYVGVNSARNFISKDKVHQNVEGLVDHIDYLIGHLDIDHVMLGLDMMDYLGGYGDNKLNESNLDDLRTHADCQNIINSLIKRGYSKDDIEKIAYKNYLQMRKELCGF